jgi:hypothetical protein
MARAWAAGLTVTTTGLNQQEKQAVKDDVESAGGRCGIAALHHMHCHLLHMFCTSLDTTASQSTHFNARLCVGNMRVSGGRLVQCTVPTQLQSHAGAGAPGAAPAQQRC